MACESTLPMSHRRLYPFFCQVLRSSARISGENAVWAGIIAQGEGQVYIGRGSEAQGNPILEFHGGYAMKKLLLFGLLIALVVSVPAIAQSAFDGMWKFNLNDAQFPKKPDVFVLQDGIYHCKTCVPPIDVKADGQDQPVEGHPYFDSVSIKVVDDRTIEETDKHDGKVINIARMTVGSDGKTMTVKVEDKLRGSNSQFTATKQ